MPSAIGFTPVDPASRRRTFLPLPAVCAAVLAILVYLNALDNPFVYDDFRLIVENSSILNASDLQAVIARDITRPVVTLSYALDTRLWGRSPQGYHVTNLLLHVINVWLVFWVAFLASEDRGRQTGLRLWRQGSSTVVAFATASLLAVHPMMTQAVGYISGRSEVAYSAFFLLAFLAGRRWMLAGGSRWWIACIGLWVVALLAKESAAMLPVALFAYDWLVLDAEWPERRRRLLRLVVPMLAVTLGAGATRVGVLLLVEYVGETPPAWRFGLVAVDAFWRYLGMLFSPRGQSIFHAVPAIDSLFSIRAIGGLVGLAGFALLAWRLRRAHRVVAFGLVWYALLLVPSSALLILGRGEAMAEHRVYLAAVGVFLTWGCAFAALWARTRHRNLVGLGAALFLAAFGFQTLVRNAIWEDPVRLSREAVSLAPGHWMPHTLTAEALRQSGRCSEAVPEYREAISLRPVEEFPYTMLARCFIQARRLDEAEDVLRQLRAINPMSQDASMGLGIFALLDGRIEESRAHFQDVTRRNARRSQAELMLAFIEGSLPEDEHLRLCEALGTLTTGSTTIDACQAETR
jgi:pentatricopeptide repeat protein